MTRKDDAAIPERRAAARALAEGVLAGDRGAALRERIAGRFGGAVDEPLLERCAEALAGESTAVEWKALPDELFGAVVDAATILERAALLSSASSAELGSKDRAKAVKKAVHALRSKGVEVDEPAAPAAPSTFKARAVEDPDAERRSVVSAPDGMGGRLMVVIADRSEGVAFVEAIFRDETLVRIAGAVMARKKVRPMVRQLFDTWGDALASVDVSIGAAGILDAEAEGRIEVPSLRGWLIELRPVLKPLAQARQHLAEPRLDEDRMRRRAGESASLFDDPVFAAWMPDRHALLECGEKVHVAMSSDLVLNEAQRHDQLAGAFARAVHEYLTDTNRRLLAGRLRHASRFLLVVGRVEDAERAWAAAATLADGGTPPFVERMFRRVFDTPTRARSEARPEREPAAEPRSRLILPGSDEPSGAGRGGGLILP